MSNGFSRLLLRKFPSLFCLLALGFALTWFGCALCMAGEPEAGIESILAKWEEASQKCRSLDAKLTVFSYETLDGDRPKIRHGRFYYEAPRLARYDIWKSAEGSTNDWSNLSEAIVWKENETLWIDGYTRLCKRFSGAKLQSFLSDAENQAETGWLQRVSIQFARRFQSPQHCFPMLVDIRATQLRERFHLTIESSGKEILLKAIPKQSPDKAWYREIDVLISTETYLTYATRVISLSEQDRTVYVLNDQKVNQRPSDRDSLIEPDLAGLRVTDELE